MSDQKMFHYDAFISYRHNEFDNFVAENLHKKLENFKLPKSVLPKVTNGKKRIERVFRDVDELPLTDNLSDPISRALLNSDFLITICTPRYLESAWCMKEIEVFLQTHSRDRVLVVLAEDEPANSFPKILCYDEVKTVNENGETIVTRREMEPLAADTRGNSKKEILKAMDIAVIKLCAAIFGLNFDDLKQRHREQRIRTLTMIFGSIGAAVLAFAIFATIMLIKISRQNTELKNNYASSMAVASGNMYEDGRRKDAAYTVRKVMPEKPGDSYNSSAVKALYTAMEVYKISPTYSPVCTYDAGSWLYGFEVYPDKKNVRIDTAEVSYLCDIDTGKILGTVNPDQELDSSDENENESNSDSENENNSDNENKNENANISENDSERISLTEENGNEIVRIKDIKDDTEYIGTTIHNVDTGTIVAELSAVDISSGKELWKVTADDVDVTFGEFKLSEDFVFFCSANDVAIIDSQKGELLKLYTYNHPIIESWMQDDALFFIDSDSSIFCCTEFSSAEYTDIFYTKVPGQKVSDARYVDGDLFCMFRDANYVVRYSADLSHMATPVNEEYELDTIQDMLPEEVFVDGKSYEADAALASHIYYSDDKKYILVICTDHTIRILDNESGRCVNSFESNIEILDDFWLSSATKSYVISGENGGVTSSLILDKNMEVICETDFIVGDEGDSLIMVSSDFKYYKVPYIDRDELIKRADEYLGDYEVADTVKQKYGIN